MLNMSMHLLFTVFMTIVLDATQKHLPLGPLGYFAGPLVTDLACPNLLL